MKRCLSLLAMLTTALMTTLSVCGQTATPPTVISGHVKNKTTLESVSAVSVTVKGGTAGCVPRRGDTLA